jgi:DNA helicase-2/ATP-dependent DNA helicase PcrA
VLLVMLSRARHGIIVTTSKTMEGRYGRYDSVISRWWAGLAASATMDIAALQTHLAQRYAASDVQHERALRAAGPDSAPVPMGPP